MTEKQYESDLTAKEKRQIEWEKIKNMNWKERIEHIWLYYKVHMIILLAILCFIGLIVQSIENRKYETMLNVTIINSGIQDMDGLEADFKAYLGDEEKYHEYVVDSNYYLTGNDSSDYNYVIKLTTMVGAQEIDVFIATKEQFEKYDEMDAFVPMDELLTPEQIEYFGDDVSETCLHFTESEKLEEFGLLPGNDYYLCVFVYTEHLDYAKEFINYAFGGEV